MNSPALYMQDDELLIRRLSGATQHLVLAFTGLQHRLGGLPMDEFIGTTANGARNHVLFISDLKRAWYSSASVVRKIVDAVKKYIAEHKIIDIVAIGNSMGGYGAILFAAHLPVSKVLAFAPQISMHPEVLQETRWIQHRPNIGAALVRSVVPSIEGTKAKFFLFFGIEDDGDTAQAALLPKLPRLRVFTLRNCNHNVAVILKKAGLLKPVFDDAFQADGSGLARILKGHLADG